MRKQDLKDYNDWDEVRSMAKEVISEGRFTKFCSWILKRAEKEQREITDQIRKRK